MQEDEPANKYIDHLLAKGFETAPAVRLMVGTVYRRQGRISDAVNSYQMGMKGVVDQEQVTLILDAELGNTYFLDGNWEQGAELFDRFVTNTTNRQYKCFSMWKLGFSWWMMNIPNRDQKVKEVNEKVIKLADNRFAYEKFSARIAKRFLAKGKYTEFDELWIHAWSFNQASRFQDSMKILQKAVDVVKAQDESRLPLAMVECVGLCLYLKMSNYNGMDQVSDASESLQKLLKIQNEIVDELWVVPHAYVEMGELYLRRAIKGVETATMYKKAGICFDRAANFSDYDFERPLSFRIARGRDLMRNAN
jgi:tetratricopeptide (TPR) repeat protein